MFEIISITAFYKGVSFVYVFFKIGTIINVYMEVERKLDFVSKLKKIDRLRIIENVERVDNIATLGGNVMMAKSLLIDEEKEKTTYRRKKKCDNKNIKMNRLYAYILDFLHRQRIRREESRELRRERRKTILENERKKKRKLEDEKNENSMYYDKGYLRCSCCRKYIEPSKMLNDLDTSAQKKMSDDKRYCQEDFNNIHNLINCDNAHNIKTLKDFDEYPEMWFFIDVNCRNCKKSFKSKVLEYELTDVYSPEVIVFLQKKRNDMIYHNKNIIEYENECV